MANEAREPGIDPAHVIELRCVWREVDRFGIAIRFNPFSNFASSMPAAVAPDNDELVVRVELANFL